MNSALLTYASNSLAVNDPLALTFANPENGISELLRRMAVNSGSPSTDVGLGIELIRRMLAERDVAVSFAWLSASPLIDVTAKEFITDNYRSMAARNESAIQLLRSWRAGDEKEQHETWEYLKRALDEDRSSERKLFP